MHMGVSTLKINSSRGLVVFKMKRALRGGLYTRNISLHCDVSVAHAHCQIQLMALARELFQRICCHLEDRTREIIEILRFHAQRIR